MYCLAGSGGVGKSLIRISSLAPPSPQQFNRLPPNNRQRHTSGPPRQPLTAPQLRYQTQFRSSNSKLPYIRSSLDIHSTAAPYSTRWPPKMSAKHRVPPYSPTKMIIGFPASPNSTAGEYSCRNMPFYHEDCRPHNEHAFGRPLSLSLCCSARSELRFP